MAYRNKVYVCFDGDNDIKYYNLMKAWKQNDNTDFNFYDAHDLNNARDTSTEETIKKKLKERLSNTKIFVVLIGNKTTNIYKFVRWEMEQALALDLPIIAVNLNGLKNQDEELCPPIIKDKLVIHIPYGQKIMQYALENWPNTHITRKNNNITGARYYIPDVYEKLGL